MSMKPNLVGWVMYWKCDKGLLYLGEIVEEKFVCGDWLFKLNLPTNRAFPVENCLWLGDFRKVRNTGYRAHRI